MTPPSSAPHRVRVWDLGTRLFHWALVVAVSGALVTGLIGGSAMAWHFRWGQAVLALLLFRLVWGLVGGRWSRFSALPLRPRSLWSHLRGRSPVQMRTGHSPLGALSVLAFLTALSVQLASGLVSNDDIAFAGPLSHLVSNSAVATATGYHKGWGKLIVLALVTLHLLAIAVYSLRGQRLVPAMVHGDKQLESPMPASRDDLRARLGAAAVLALAAAASAWVFSLAPAGF